MSLIVLEGTQDTMACFHATVKGRVQGVGYRFFTYDEARAFGINGWVRNLYNNDVEVMAEGEKEILDQFLRQLKKGPALARVSDLQIEWLAEDQGFKEFKITF